MIKTNLAGEAAGPYPGLECLAKHGTWGKGAGAPCCPMTRPAVLLNNLFLSSAVLSGSMMMDVFASTVRLASRLAAVSSAAAASMPLLLFGRVSAAAPSSALTAPSAVSVSPCSFRGSFRGSL